MGLDNPLHLALLVVVLLLLFGAKRLPEIGRSLGSGMREFKQSISGETPHQTLPPAPQQPPVQQPVQQTQPQPAQPVQQPQPVHVAAGEQAPQQTQAPAQDAFAQRDEG
jgi:sec-independent protein translocase protein TatA